MKRKQQIFDYKEVNELLDRLETFSIVKYNMKYEDRDPKLMSLGLYSFVKFNPKNVIITSKYGFNMLPTTYIFTRDDSKAHLKQGSEEYAVFKRACGEYVPDFSNDEWTINHLGKHEGKFCTKNAGIQQYNEKFLYKAVYAYQYDLNSAYLSVQYKSMPDTRFPQYDTILNENECGFIVSDTLTLVTTPGMWVDIKFPIIETPDSIKRYCERWFKRCVEDPANKIAYKHQIVDSYGYLQYHNPYLRAYIVETCNNMMLALYDKDHTILFNTDAVYSDIKLDLDIGPNIGQYKLKEGLMSITGLDYDSEDFGSVHRGQQKNNYYEVVNNRLRRIDDEI